MKPRLLLLGVTLCSGCAPHLPTPLEALHVGEGFSVVPHPPPVARIEFIPPRPAKGTVWVDGGWEWTGRDYAWRDGGWMVPPEPGARYAPPAAVRSPNGQLYFHPAAWYRADGSLAALPRSSR